MAKIAYDGLDYDTDTRKVTFTKKVCWDCKGTGLVTRAVLCPRYGRKQAGKACEHCGSKSQHNHKAIGDKIVKCSTCVDGYILSDMYTSVNVTALLQHIDFEFTTSRRSTSFNEGYLGIGVFAGCTDYGRYMEGGNPKENIMKDLNNSFHTQSMQLGNILTKDGYLVSKVVIFMVSDGWHGYALGAAFGR
jgi:RecJ-like exonuclease